MSQLDRLLALLPPPYADAEDSVLARLLDVLSLELEAIQEDVDRMRQTHWVRFVYRVEDLDKLAALLGIERFPWEGLAAFRARLLAVVPAHLQGAVGRREIQSFVVDYLRAAQKALPGATFVPGLETVPAGAAFEAIPERPLFRPFRFVENPERERASQHLVARGGRVPYLHRWTEENRGLDETVATFVVGGYPKTRTAVPILVNVTTGDLVGFGGALAFGEVLVIERGAAGANGPRPARATIGDADVTAKLFSVSGFEMGVPFSTEDLDLAPQLPRMARGPNEWVFLSVGLFDVRGLNRFFFAIADDQLREGVFDETFFDHAVFPSGTIARVRMAWIETEPASFEVHVPRHMVMEPLEAIAPEGPRPYENVGEALRVTVDRLHAAGVRSRIRFAPFSETQEQRDGLRLPWKVLEPETGPTGRADVVEIGGRFGESVMDRSRFE